MMEKTKSAEFLSEKLEGLSRILLEESTYSFRDIAVAAGLDPSTDFRGASLRDMDFRDEDLSGFDFSGADLAGSDFRRAILTETSFAGADLYGVIGLPEFAELKKPDIDLTEMLKAAKRQIISGVTPDPSWLPFIEKLRLGNSGIRSLEALKSLHSLKYLSLKRTSIQKIRELSNLKSLVELALDDSYVDDISPLERLTNLSTLTMGGINPVDLSPLSQLKNLRALTIAQARNGNLEPLGGLTELRRLNIGPTAVNSLDPLANLAKLRHLSLNISGDDHDLGPISNLKNIEYLILFCNSTDLSLLSDLKKLFSLYIRNAVCEKLPKIGAREYISTLSISGSSFKDLGGLSELKRGGTFRFQNLKYADFSPLKNVEELTSLTITRNENLKLEYISHMSNLRSLNLDYCGIKDVFLLANFKNLRYLSLEGNNIEDISPLKVLKSLQVLDLTNTKVSDVSSLTCIPNLSIRGV